MASMKRSDSWEVVEAPQQWDEQLYEEIESNKMCPCQVKVGSKSLYFCLEAKAADKDEARRCAATLTNSCRTCMHRITKFAYFTGAEGKHVAFCQEVSDPTLDRIRKIQQDNATSLDVTDYNLVVIDAQFLAKYPVTVGPFPHVHFQCDQLTSDDTSQKIQQLSTYLNGSFENRFQRLVDDPASLQVIQNEIPKLVRPSHWKPVTDWAVRFVAKANGQRWAELAAHDKYAIMAFAMLTGRSEGSVHFDMQQASNLVDFMDGADNSAALRAMMDDRSNPETYQVSRVADLLRQKCVSSLCTVTLTWGLDGQPHKSDLDLHTKVSGQELYYGKKQVGKCKLDFDANASQIERNPAENISLNQPGTFEFRVNNYNNRDCKDVPFEVTVRKPGSNQVFTGVWPKGRANGNYLKVCTVTVTLQDLQEPQLSEAEQKKLSAKEAEWESMFGEVTSRLVTDEELEISPLKALRSSTSSVPPQRSAQEAFSKLLAGKPRPMKPTLAERCQLETLPSFLEYVLGNQCSLEVNPRNFAPAYITCIETKTEVLTKKYAINSYHRKNELPQQPRSDEPGSARFDSSWGVSNRAAVRGFLEVNGTWFMVLEKAQLPEDPSWPLGAGMYPTHLKPEVHQHRSKWTSFHSLMTPTIPATGAPLIGSALVGFSSFTFTLNGREVVVRP
eukprot:TRINITY_DN76214_c0_g1_i1.p1 TRINITY_DN76214_c0_g1~~TRINITY_DN76214_c0_g1_i1.p1  ORF type:complete len:689 (+),score=138.33 TRINITY_DN76214_c0_g1_i1:52-2067(+)